MYIKGTYIKPSFIIAYVTPVITQSLKGGVVGLNGSFTFTVKAIGSPPLTYSWFRNDVPIINQKNSTYIISNAALSNDANYYCKVSNNSYTVKSNIVRLQVLKPVSIVTQPTTLYLNQNDTDFLTVSGIGSEPIVYNWYKNNLLITSSSINKLYIVNANSTDIGTYYCKITNPISFVDSNTARVELSQNLSIVSIPSDVSINPTKTVNVNLICTGTPPITAQWKKDGTDYKAAIIINSGGTIPLVISNIQNSDEGEYKCVLTNKSSTITSGSFKIYVNKNVGFTLQPIASTVNVGTNYTFTVNTTGTDVITYGWYTDNPVTYLNKTNKSLTLNSIEIDNQGDYFCVATNMVNSVTSNIVTLTVSSNYLIARNGDYIILDTNTYWNLN